MTGPGPRGTRYNIGNDQVIMKPDLSIYYLLPNIKQRSISYIMQFKNVYF